jgi:pyruvate dehydrogenase E2 component (dihydrolipoamide acetyltransferase)
LVAKVVMPRLSLTMKEGTVGKWYKAEGDRVDKDEPLVEVLSEKATYDVEAPSSGILKKIVVCEGLDVPVNAVLAIITGEGEALPLGESLKEPTEAETTLEERVVASPAAKRLAKELGIDLASVMGTGPGGRISEEDVENSVKGSGEFLPRVKEVIALSGYRKTSAERLSRSFRTAPHSTVIMYADASRMKALHESDKISFTAILVNALAKALTKRPQVNSSFEDGKMKIFEDINIGIATATDHGLSVPIVRNADQQSLQQLETTIKQLTEKARQMKLEKKDTGGGTFTITNLGMFGVEFFLPIINPPEAAILAVGSIVEKPVVVNGELVVKPLMGLSLSYDHRIVDGAPAAEFLRLVKKLLEGGDLGSA